LLARAPKSIREPDDRGVAPLHRGWGSGDAGGLDCGAS
jgi:hypothetical protein